MLIKPRRGSTSANMRILKERRFELGLATPARTIALTLRVSNPAAFLKHWTLPVLGLLERPRIPLLGYYLGVQNASGRLVFATSRLPDTGGVFVIPSLDACSPVGHGEPALYQPPPCPAR